MKQHRTVIQCQEKAVVVTSPNGDRISVEVAVQAQPTATVNQLGDDANQEDQVVNEFSDVFPDELLGMPPNHDIEFLIELLPRTAPKAKRPYRMGIYELEELKKQVLFALVLHPKEHQLSLLTRKMAHGECVLIIGHLMK
jgi:hypothetical protein